LDEIVYEGENAPAVPVSPVMAAPSPQPTVTPAASIAEEAPAPAVAPEKSTETVRRVIPFSNALTAFDDAAKSALGEIVDLAAGSDDVTVVIEGHTDNVGSAETNMRLSKERAAAVADYLSAQGVKRDRMIVIGYGEDKPVSPDSNATPEGRAKNRRVEIVVMKK
jgi:OOP family OmpA-OmpF porin